MGCASAKHKNNREFGFLQKETLYYKLKGGKQAKSFEKKDIEDSNNELEKESLSSDDSSINQGSEEGIKENKSPYGQSNTTNKNKALKISEDKQSRPSNRLYSSNAKANNENIR